MPPTPIRFIVPWLAAGMRVGANCANARKTVSAMRCVVSVLPAHTAAGGCASRKEPAGISISTGRRMPALAGVVAAVRILMAKNEGGGGVGGTGLVLRG